MTYTTTRTITLPSSALWTQIESYIQSYGGTVEAVSGVPEEHHTDCSCAVDSRREHRPGDSRYLRRVRLRPGAGP